MRWSSALRSASAAAVLSAVALGAGCGAGGGEAATERPPPSVLTVSMLGGDPGAFHVRLLCDVADRAACARVLEAVRELQAREDCSSVDGGEARIEISGSIEGEPVREEISRRTDCGVRAYDRVRAGLGP